MFFYSYQNIYVIFASGFDFVQFCLTTLGSLKADKNYNDDRETSG